MTDRPHPQKSKFRTLIKYTLIKHGKYKKLTHTRYTGTYLSAFEVNESMDRLAYHFLTTPETWKVILVSDNTELTLDEIKITAYLEIQYTSHALGREKQVKKTIQVAETLTLRHTDMIQPTIKITNTRED